MDDHLRHMNRIRHIHFVGVGGVGMAGIAEVLLNLGYTISGSDVADSSLTQRLSRLGATIFLGHHAEHVVGADVLVTSTAVATDNSEVLEARRLHIPVIPRAEMLAELMRFQYGIAISGTHGKTTTTSLVTSILTEARLDPTFVIGGKLNSAGANAQLGTSKYVVAEADESDASFLHLSPMVVIVTNIDADHLQTYGGDFSRLRQTFVDFVHRLPFYGLAILCVDDPVVREILPQLKRPYVTYGFNADADYRLSTFKQVGQHVHFCVHRKKQGDTLSIELSMPGEHNALNATAAIAVASDLAISVADMTAALAQFKGVGRRFQVTSGIIFNGHTVTIVDDYAHHPREMVMTLKALKNCWPSKRLVLVFQPHRYSRTHELFDDFCRVLAEAPVDEVILLEVYGAGELPLDGVSSKALAGNIRRRSDCDPILIEGIDDLSPLLCRMAKDGDIVLAMGAGNIGKWVNSVVHPDMEKA